ncbi:PD-(D/E)XK nuclease-like domain-containing protein [Fulvimarina endophytica]|uniref:PD-(D/E)XK nuclease-like domain-containing protein n=1 Tax=Fulvimarina endophytica TaxID=2293836 RepID=UPI001FE141F0|nr:PD-(D/E)XK nuclease-like domain-containing protein [Fulvimarina endophytica]
MEGKTSDALDFGKCVHCLLLGDEVFKDAFEVRPEQWKDYKPKAAQEWRDAVRAAGKTPVTLDDLERVRRIADDAANYPEVRQGILNGRVERTIAWKDEETGIWVRCRPDVLSNADGVFADLKTCSSFSEDFLERQAFDACYWLQGAMTRFVCRHLGMPFETFVLLYVLNNEVPDTTHVELSQHELDRGERALRWSLRTIRQCLNNGSWPGARPFRGGESDLQLKPFHKSKIDDFLEREEALHHDERAAA